MIKIHISDRHQLFANGVASTINQTGIAEVSGISNNLEDCLKAIRKDEPDILIIDIFQSIGKILSFSGGTVNSDITIVQNRSTQQQLYFYPSNGIDFCTKVKKYFPDIKIIILTSCNHWVTTKYMKNLGADGYLLKTSKEYEIVNAIKYVYKGLGFYMTVALHKQLSNIIQYNYFWLDVDEQILLKLMAEDLTNAEIALILPYKEETIKSKRRDLLEKFRFITNSKNLNQTLWYIIGNNLNNTLANINNSRSIVALKTAMQIGLIWEDNLA